MPSQYLSIAQCGDLNGGIAVVIDVVRAFTTAALAFDLGAERIVLSDDVAEALRLKAMLPGSLAMKDDFPEPGFELTNSPVMLAGRDLSGHTIVQKTTHGTVGAVAAKRAERLYCASFAVASATAAAIRGTSADVRFVVTGEDGTADEDRACADYIAALLEDPSAAAAPYLARVATSGAAMRARERAAEGHPGFARGDVEMCMRANIFDFTMQAVEEDGLLVLRRHL